MHEGRGHATAGFTLIELLIVLVVLGILVAIAVPVYLGASARAGDTAAKANIRAVAVAAELFAADNNGTRNDADGRRRTTGYRGMTMALLRAKYDAGLAPTVSFFRNPRTTSYCVRDTQRGSTWSAAGPGISSSSFRNNGRCR